MPLAEYIFGHVQRFEGTLYIDFYFRKIHNTSFQLNSNPRLNKFQYGHLVFFEKLVFFEFLE